LKKKVERFEDKRF